MGKILYKYISSAEIYMLCGGNICCVGLIYVHRCYFDMHLGPGRVCL